MYVPNLNRGIPSSAESDITVRPVLNESPFPSISAITPFASFSIVPFGVTSNAKHGVPTYELYVIPFSFRASSSPKKTTCGKVILES